jgi:hypothetical protein
MLIPTVATKPTARNAVPSATSDEIVYALDQALLALRHNSAVGWLQAYYHPTGNYAGNSFLGVAPNDPGEINSSDLFAISLLNVQVWPRSARRLLEAAGDRQAVREALAQVPVEADLATANTEVWEAAERLYRTVKPLLGQNAWVTASKLCARKRPHFFPVRDRVVTVNRLGLGRYTLVDWEVYRHLITDAEVQQTLTELVAQASQGGSGAVPILDPPLMVLDALLWMSSRKKKAL